MFQNKAAVEMWVSSHITFTSSLIRTKKLGLGLLVCPKPKTISQLMEVEGISSSDKEKIAGKNAERLLGV